MPFHSLFQGNHAQPPSHSSRPLASVAEPTEDAPPPIPLGASTIPSSASSTCSFTSGATVVVNGDGSLPSHGIFCGEVSPRTGLPCNRVFASIGFYHIHVRFFHLRDNYSCVDCGRSFGKDVKAALEHVIGHSRFQHECSSCSFQYAIPASCSCTAHPLTVIPARS
ncbi:hypothetical protein DL93DRAFT_330436 [Clavulina sp. PMI_390]|nr:hypothetical protein DL93DRAFT_330436 [Clavulina sp. PMI_390]